MEVKELESAIEGILFAAGDPVGVERLCLALGQDRATVDGVCRRLADRFSYERRGVRIVQLDSSWQMCSAPEYASVIRKVLESRRPAKLSQPALEVLAIIAYFQPVTRAYVDQVRGVDSSYTVGLLLERELIEEAGRLAVPGRPIQYRTTKNFLRTFGLTKLEELPELPGAVGEDGQLTLALEGLEGAAAAQKPETALPGEVPESAAEETPPGEVPESVAEKTQSGEQPEPAAEETQSGEQPEPAAEETQSGERPEPAAEETQSGERPEPAAEETPPEKQPEPAAEEIQSGEASESVAEGTPLGETPEPIAEADRQLAQPDDADEEVDAP